MGIFSKAKMAMSGVNGQIELNIRNAFDYLEKDLTQLELQEFHNANQAALCSFVWNIAAEAWISVHPEAAYSHGRTAESEKLALLCMNVLESKGYTITIDFFDQTADELGLGECGSNYMSNVLEGNKKLYLEAIRDTVHIVRRGS